MPAVQPAELWEESGRWSNFGPELLRLRDRHDRDFCVGPTHEEVITDIARREVRSYKQLPVNLYQIQTKFRDEIRPRFGVMRAREFIMKDAYSFDLDADGLERSYLAMHDAYCRTFERLGLDYRVVDADSGRNRRESIAGVSCSGRLRGRRHRVLRTAASRRTSSWSRVRRHQRRIASGAGARPIATVDTPGRALHRGSRWIFSAFPPSAASRRCWSRVTTAVSSPLPCAATTSSTPIKAARTDGVRAPLVFARPERVREVMGCDPGSLGTGGRGHSGDRGRRRPRCPGGFRLWRQSRWRAHDRGELGRGTLPEPDRHRHPQCG